MRKLLPVALILAAFGGLYAAQAPTIAAREAKAHLGQAVVIEDAVVQVTREIQSGVTYLNFGAAFPNHVFRVVIPDRVRALIAPAVLGAERVRVRGVPTLGPQDIPEILCAEPAQLSALGPEPSGAAGLATTPPPAQPPTRTCCRVCTTGKACGNSCIARNLTCRQPPGCACNGR